MARLRTFYKLEEAIRFGNANNLSVWAEDYNDKKKFLVGSLNTIVDHCKDAKTPSIYEVLQPYKCTRLYFDVEINHFQQAELKEAIINKNVELLQLSDDIKRIFYEVVSLDITEDFCQFFLKCFKTSLIAYVEHTLSITLSDQDITVLSACRSSKLSFHIVCPTLVFDEHNTSIAFYIEDYAHYFVTQILTEITNPGLSPFDQRHLVRCLCLNQAKVFAVDLAPYGKTQQFRMFGCGKKGKAPLRIIKDAVTPLIAPLDYRWDFESMWTGLVSDKLADNILTQYRVQPLSVEDNPIHISPGKSTRRSAVKFYEQSPSSSLICDFIGPRCDPLYQSRVTRPRIDGHFVPFRTAAESSNCVDVTNSYKIFNEQGREVAIDTLGHNDYVFCQECELGEGIPYGEPSARIIQDNDRWLVYCFNCNETILKIVDTFQFMPLTDTEHILLQNRYLNQGIIDVDLESETHRVYAIDAPTGSGKSYMLRQWIKSDALFYSKVIFIYSKQGLCRAMSSYFDIPCYLDFHPDDWESPPDKFVICLNSIIKLPHLLFTHAIVFDEGGLTRKDTCAQTIIPILNQVLVKLEVLIMNTNKLVLCQHNLSQTDLDYYLNFVAANLNNEQIFKRIFTQDSAKVITFV
jgi:hypothetical protein